MIGDHYWSTGITLRWTYAGNGEHGWYALAEFTDGGFCDDASTEGTIHARYVLPDRLPSRAVDLVKADAERLGIRWGTETVNPTIYYEGDGESADYPPPEGWREIVRAECERLGWRCVYRD